jgi:transcriptional regulator with XRE-family HTH domain
MKFGEKLRKLRHQALMTQAEVAKCIGVSRRTYISYEQEGRYPRHREVYHRLAETFKCPLNYLLTEDEVFVDESTKRYGSIGKRQAEELVAELSGLFAGGSLSEQDKDAVMIALQKAYFDCKEDNRKYAGKRAKKEDHDD